MIRVKNFNASQDFVDFIRVECGKLEDVLCLKEQNVSIYVFGKVDDLCDFSPEYCEVFRSGQSTIVSKSLKEYLLFLVQENWEARGRKLWKGMLAESLCFTLIENVKKEKFRNRLGFLMFKIRRFVKVHSILADLNLYDYSKPILEDMIEWRIANIRDFNRAMILRNETGAMMFLSYIYPAIIALPYARKGCEDARKKISILIKYTPKILRDKVAEMLSTRLSLEDVIVKLADFVDNAYFVAL